MKRFLSLILLLCSYTTFAQQHLSQSRHTSVYTYIYSLSNSELIRLHTGELNETFLHNLVDSFPIADELPSRIPPGNYLKVNALESHLNIVPLILPNVYYKILHNGKDLVITLHDVAGNEVKDATVLADKRKVEYDQATHAWRINNYDHEAILQITHKGMLHYVPLDHTAQSSRFSRFLNKVTGAVRPGYWYRYIRWKLFRRSYQGFIAFSKPIYKPNDTVRLKAFILNDNGKPINEPLSLRLRDGYYSHTLDTALSTIQPYRAGAYEYQFVLSDGLHLKLNSAYYIILEKKGKRVVLGDRFSFREYELHNITFSARTDKSIHTRDQPVALYLKARDENDLAVMDGSVKIRISTNTVNTYGAPYLFVPDTLWTCSIKMDAPGETKVLIPDSIFPAAASVSYTIHCDFLNTNNESKHASISQDYLYIPYQFKFEGKDDSLQMTFTNAGAPIPQTAMLSAVNNEGDTIQKIPVSLPAAIKINPYVSTYSLTNNRQTESYAMNKSNGQVQCISTRTSDSIDIQVINPRKLFFWYTIFAGDKIKLRGYGDTLSWKAATTTHKNYHVSIQYIWAGETGAEEHTVTYTDKNLNVTIDAPAAISPGQKARIGISVTDVNNKPVADADVTAYAFTSKFNQTTPPAVPYMGTYYRDKKSYNNFIPQQPTVPYKTLPLNWQRWSREMGLDSISYFRFLYPDAVFRHYEPIPDNETEIAPFVTGKGNIIPVHILYVNEIPVFFSNANQLQRYSFPIKSGWNKIAMRTPYQRIVYDSVFMVKGMKNILSLDTAVVYKHIDVERRPSFLDQREAKVLENYMIRVDHTFRKNSAYIRQGNKLYWMNYEFNSRQTDYHRSNYLIGPIMASAATLNVQDDYRQVFLPESDYEYNINPGLIKQKSICTSEFYRYSLNGAVPAVNFEAHPLREAEIDSIMMIQNENYIRGHNIFDYHSSYIRNPGRLSIKVKNDTLADANKILQFLLYSNKIYYVRSYAGTTTNFGPVSADSSYRIIVILSGNRYFETDSFMVAAHGVNYYEIKSYPVYPISSTSTNKALQKWNKFITKEKDTTEKQMPMPAPVAPKYRPSEIRISYNGPIRQINGIVRDNVGEVLVGASIRLQGTSSGTSTNEDGEFQMNVPTDGVLHISYIGFETQVITLKNGYNFEVYLEPNHKMLSEVVVTSLGIRREQKSLAYSVVKIESKSLENGKKKMVPTSPMIILDGLPYNGKLESISPATIKSITRLSGEEATDLYGSDAEAGVIIVTTNKAALTGGDLSPEGFQSNNLRRNFHDDAFWQPRLRTDTSGHASFEVTFPDDITNWRTLALVMADHKQTGSTTTNIKSFKALSANLGLPTFAVAGDTVNVIGKIMNYTPDSITVGRTFAANDSTYKTGMLTFKNAGIDTFPVAIRAGDSATFKYIVQKDGVPDGEERKIPVIQQGTMETSGFFAALYKDTSFTYTPIYSDRVKLYAVAEVLPILMDEIKYVQRYEYLCNEQLASKLKTFLMEKKICTAIQRPFKGEKDILEILAHLEKGKNGLQWGWWPNTPVSLWVSRHVTAALLMAEEAGYAINLNKQAQIDHLAAQLNQRSESDSIGCMMQLADLNAKIDYKSYIDSFAVHHKNLSVYARLRLAQLQQKAGLPMDLPFILSGQHHTLFGNVYWGDDSYYFFDNSIQETLLTYQILRKQGGYDELLQKVRGFFLEQRKDGHWRNTYESSLILETILPDVMAEQARGNAELKIGDSTITKFPYAATVQGTVNISKKGGLAVYFTAYQQFHNSHPEKLFNKFSVSSSFGKDKLSAGEAVTLSVEIYAEAAAEYVLVEIPIPAGCSYVDQSQAWSNNEVHREYFKHKVSIFCSSLSKGKHTFTVSLLPRYTGSYHLNPAKVELQYFPVFMGREGMKKVEIR